MRKCEICGEREAAWAVQFVSDETPTFTLLGSHYRGYRLLRVCDACKEGHTFLECRCGEIAYAEKDMPASGDCVRCENDKIDEALHGDPENAREYLERSV